LGIYSILKMSKELGVVIGTGKTAEIYTLEKDKVIKLFYPEELAEIIQHEHSLANEVFSLGISTPEVFGFVNLQNRSGIVFERVFGENLLNHLKSKPWRAKYIGRSMARFHAILHAYAVPHWNDRSCHLKGKIRLSTEILGKRNEQIIRYLEGLPTGQNLCHGDFHPKNIMFHENKIVLIDWGDAYSGNCLGDVARTLLILKSPHIPTGVSSFLTLFSKPIKNQIYGAYLKEYMKITGVAYADLSAWLLPVAAARIEERISNEQDWLMNIIDSELALRC